MHPLCRVCLHRPLEKDVFDRSLRSPLQRISRVAVSLVFFVTLVRLLESGVGRERGDVEVA